MALLLVLGWLVVVGQARQEVFQNIITPGGPNPQPGLTGSPTTGAPTDSDTIPEDAPSPGFSPDIIVRKSVHGKKKDGPFTANAYGASGSGGPLSYHGGPIIPVVQLFYIYYGDWSSRAAGQAYLNNFAQSLGGSSWYNIQTTYYNSAGTHIANAVTWGGAFSVPAIYGTSLTDAQIPSIVTYAFGNLGLGPPSSQGIYVVLTAASVSIPGGFCSSYCGYHAHATYNGADYKYAFVGNAETMCPSGCISNTATLSGDGIGVDGMASVIAHEVAEAASDPDLNAWYSSTGYENGDNCAWQFGATSTKNNGARYNLVLNGYKYLVQQNWVNVINGGYCASSL